MECDVASLLGAVGTSLAIMHAFCGCEKGRGIARDVADLASASLTGCVYVDTDANSADEEHALTSTPMSSYEQAEEVMGRLIKPSVLILGHQQAQSDTVADLCAQRWISDALKSMDSGVTRPFPCACMYPGAGRGFNAPHQSIAGCRSRTDNDSSAAAKVD